MSIWKHTEPAAHPAHNDTTARDVAGNHTRIIPAVDSTTALQLTKADGVTPLLNIDTLAGVVRVGDIVGNNDMELEAAGVMRFKGTGKVWNDLIMPAVNLRPGQTPPDYAAFLGAIYGFRFNAGESQSMYGATEMAHDYFEGGDLHFHLHWSPTTTNNGNIVWGIEYSLANVGDVFPAPTIVAATPTATQGVVNRHQLQSVVVIPGAGIRVGAILTFRVFRQNGGTDTFTGGAFLHSVGVHYLSDTLGSRSIASK